MDKTPHLQIKRFEKNEDGVFGELFIDGTKFCYTLEPEDKNNERNISCIPTGKYVCKRYHSIKYPDTYRITNVPNRDLILFHCGNTEDDTRGCILLGYSLGFVDGKNAVMNSKIAFERFLKMLEKWDLVDLEIGERK